MLKELTEELYGAIEVSTSKVRFMIMAGDGEVVWSRFLKQGTVRGPSGNGRQRPSRWLRRIARLVANAQADGMPLERLAAIGVTCTTPTLVPVDQRNTALNDEAVLWCDTAVCGQPNARCSNVGLRKMAAFAKSDAHLFRNCHHVADATGYVISQLTGSLVSTRAALLQKFAWLGGGQFDTEGLDELPSGLVNAMLQKIPPNVANTGQLVGTVSPLGSERTGIPSGTPIVACGYDSISALPGGGICEPSTALLASLGTSVAFYLCPHPQVESIGQWATGRGLLPGNHYIASGGFEAGMQSIDLIHRVVRLACQVAGDRELEEVAKAGEARFDHHCIALPFGGVPLRAPLAGRCFQTHVMVNAVVPTPEHLLIAMRRGIACYLRYSIEDLRSHGVGVERVHLVGGGTKSPSFCKLVADCCQVPVVRFDASAASVGTAILAEGSLRGQLRMNQRIRQLTTTRTIFSPTERIGFYDEVYQGFHGQLERQMDFVERTSA